MNPLFLDPFSFMMDDVHFTVTVIPSTICQQQILVLFSLNEIRPPPILALYLLKIHPYWLTQ